MSDTELPQFLHVESGMKLMEGLQSKVNCRQLGGFEKPRNKYSFQPWNMNHYSAQKRCKNSQHWCFSMNGKNLHHTEECFRHWFRNLVSKRCFPVDVEAKQNWCKALLAVVVLILSQFAFDIHWVESNVNWRVVHQRPVKVRGHEYQEAVLIMDGMFSLITRKTLRLSWFNVLLMSNTLWFFLLTFAWVHPRRDGRSVNSVSSIHVQRRMRDPSWTINPTTKMF